MDSWDHSFTKIESVLKCIEAVSSFYCPEFPNNFKHTTVGSSTSLIIACAPHSSEVLLISLAQRLFERTSQKSWAPCHRAMCLIYVRLLIGESRGDFTVQLMFIFPKSRKSEVAIVPLSLLGPFQVKRLESAVPTSAPTGAANLSQCGSKSFFSLTLAHLTECNSC